MNTSYRVLSHFTLFCCKIICLRFTLFCRYLRAFAWRKIEPKIVPVGENIWNLLTIWIWKFRTILANFFWQMLTNSCKLLWIIIINNVIISNNWEPQMTIIVTWHWLEWALGQQHVIKLKWTSLISLFQKNWAKIEMDIFDMYLYLTKPKRRWGWHF